MARDISKGSPSIYRQVDRFSGLFRALLASPVSPDASATAIRHIIESGTWQLRHLPGPNAAPFVGWRASITDEQWWTGMLWTTTPGTRRCSVTLGWTPVGLRPAGFCCSFVPGFIYPFLELCGGYCDGIETIRV